jgi:methylated-DNA-[protein]-cysteine S-methyltransferase
MKLQCSITTPLGEMVALVEQDSLCELRFTGQKYAREDAGEFRQKPDHPVLVALRRQLDAYFAGNLQIFDLPLAPKGTPFRMAVWALLRTIPAGTTTTYGALARRVAKRRGGSIPAAQAVGGAVGHNPIAIIIPCHRVVGTNESLTGYAAGLDRKAALLALEKAEIMSLRS